MVSHYENLKSFFEETFPRVDKYTRKHRRVIKYVIAGGTAAATNIGSLFILVHFFSIYYLVAAVASWTISFCVSFALQKFWTFGSRNLDKAHKELVIYFTVSIASLVVDTYLLYLFVEFLHIHYLISQIVIGLATAVVTYSINKFIIFKKHNTAGGHVILIAAANYPPDPGGPATHAQKYVEEFVKKWQNYEIKKDEDRIAFSEAAGIEPKPTNNPPRIKSIRTKEWKFIFNRETKKAELYNIIKDPLEEKDIIEENKKKAIELFEELKRLDLRSKNEELSFK